MIKSGANVTIKGYESDRVTAETTGKSGSAVEQKGRDEIARARAAVGDHVLFDLRFKLPVHKPEDGPDDMMEVQIGGNGEVWVPFGSNLKIYAGKDIEVQNVHLVRIDFPTHKAADDDVFTNLADCLAEQLSNGKVLVPDISLP